MEFAEENFQPFLSSSARISGSVKILLTPVWASSKLPRMAQTERFSPSWVVICRFCMGLTPSSG